MTSARYPTAFHGAQHSEKPSGSNFEFCQAAGADMPRREPQRPNHGRQAAGLRSAFLPAGGFQGPKEGYEFKKGDQGVGYYRVHERASRTDFLAALE